MALFGWSERDKVREDAFQAGINSVSDREVAVGQKERTQAKRAVELEAWSDKLNALNKNHDEIEVDTNAKKMALANASFELEKARFEMVKEQVANDALQLEKKLKQKDEEWRIRLDTMLAEQSVTALKSTQELADRIARADAKSDAKDIIIDSKDKEIARLDELLKVTMGKLTQIDIKGLSIHVENSKKEDKE